MVFIQPVSSTTEFEDNRPWLVWVERGDNVSGTLNVSAFTGALRSGDYIVSGTPVVKDAGTGLWSPAAADAKADGIVFTKEYAPSGVTRVAAAIMTRGTVTGEDYDADNLPATIRVEG